MELFPVPTVESSIFIAFNVLGVNASQSYRIAVRIASRPIKWRNPTHSTEKMFCDAGVELIQRQRRFTLGIKFKIVFWDDEVPILEHVTKRAITLPDNEVLGRSA